MIERRCRFVRGLLTLVLRLAEVEVEVGRARRHHRCHLLLLLVVAG